ncbi:MAG: hypothetical protein IPP57_22395 [Candidatus Obscuribacter sp.]|jgi:hypothetical protein|nr:hypothetical protein [Candidatus Obscuribacter sp.]MBK9621178.1 hypothetical protein [Candidatus Obscuribacter sp.]MBK9773528.1 hypothetical protein [Candidatus Obscuribacter sp.]
MNQTLVLPPPSQYHVRDFSAAVAQLPPCEHSQDNVATSGVDAARAFMSQYKVAQAPVFVSHTLASGPIKSLSLHKRWQQNEFAGKIYRRFQWDLSSDVNSRITVRLSRMALSESTRTKLVKIVEEGRFRPGNRILFADQVKHLSEFFGSASIGRNQYTVSNPSDYKTTFHFESSSMIWIKGQASILVEGKFLNADASVSRYFIGAFVPYEGERGTMVMEIALTTATREAYLVHKAELKQVLNTIEPRA